jgi:PAS domain S-box-containing protein
VFSIDADGRIDSWNKGAKTIFGYPAEEMIGRPYEFIFTPDDIERGVPAKEMRLARRKGRAFDERWHVRRDGSQFFASGVMMPLFLGRTLTGYAKIASDLTQKKRHAEELQHARDELEMRVRERTRELAESNFALVKEMEERDLAEKQRIDLLRRLVTSQELERRRIARDIHDQLGQRLTALRLKIASLAEVAPADEPFASRISRLQEISERLDNEVSFLAWELRPSALDDLGLVDAIGAFVNEWSRHYDIPAAFHSAGVVNARFGNDAETHLYRIIQEALNNIAKHAGASYVSVLFEKRGDHFILIAEDDGTGFAAVDSEAPDAPGGGLGLVGMRERAALIGAEIEIESAPGQGTTIYVRVPEPAEDGTSGG